jgi:hypothetical protein
MEKDIGLAPNRRTLLQRGLALLGAGVGLSGLPRAARAEAPEAVPGSTTLTLLGWRRPEARVKRGSTVSGPHAVCSGVLRKEADGDAVGSFYTNRFSRETPLGAPLPAGSNIEFQTFTLEEGMLFGLGAGPAGGERVCAILGGTGRFCGARGSYLERPASPASGSGAVEFMFTLKA